MTDKRQVLIAVVAGAVGAVALGAVLTYQSGPPDTAAVHQQPAPQDAPLAPSAVDPEEPQSPNEQANLSVDSAGDALVFTARFPQAPHLNAVASGLAAETQSYYERVQREAQAAAGSGDETQWELNITWRPIASAGGYVSLLGRSSEYRGGAHPIELIDTRLMAIEQGEDVDLSTFLASGWSTPAVTIAICEALKAKKIEKIGEPTIMGEPIVCAGPQNNLSTKEAKVAFAASTENDKFGGMHVFYQPYLVGAYSEGSYELLIPYEVFAEDLTKEHQNLFAGSPLPLDP